MYFISETLHSIKINNVWHIFSLKWNLILIFRYNMRHLFHFMQQVLFWSAIWLVWCLMSLYNPIPITMFWSHQGNLLCSTQPNSVFQPLVSRFLVFRCHFWYSPFYSILVILNQFIKMFSSSRTQRYLWTSFSAFFSVLVLGCEYEGLGTTQAS